jgi:hypothetical protein
MVAANLESLRKVVVEEIQCAKIALSLRMLAIPSIFNHH